MVYLRSESEDDVVVQIVQAKARVAPLKKLTIPRLEHLSATIGARLTNSVIKNTGLTDIPVYYWTDSTTVLAWIKREDHGGAFVGNRVKEIKLLTNVQDWNHVPGDMNAAHLPSRGCSPLHLVKLRWWEGPCWLKNPPTELPNEDYRYDESDINQEKKRTAVLSLTNIQLQQDWYYRYFSKFNQIIRLVVWIRRFIHNCRSRNNKVTGDLSLQEINDAEKRVLKLVQSEAFDGVSDTKIPSLCPFMAEDNLIRLRKR